MPKTERRGKPRLRVRYHQDSRTWYAALLDPVKNHELDISPAGTEAEAEGYMEIYRRFGAWKKS